MASNCQRDLDWIELTIGTLGGWCGLRNAIPCGNAIAVAIAIIIIIINADGTIVTLICAYVQKCLAIKRRSRIVVPRSFFILSQSN